VTSTTTLPLFGKDAEPDPPEVRLGMAAASARLVAYRDTHTGDLLAHLVVACPFCDHQHIHPAGPASAPRTCPRRSRCVGRPGGGSYYFPEVAAW